MDAAFRKRYTMRHLLILLIVCVLEVLGLNNLAHKKETFESWNNNHTANNGNSRTVVDGIMRTDFANCIQPIPNEFNKLWQGYSWLLVKIGDSIMQIDLVTLTVNMSSLQTDVDVANVFVGSDTSNSSTFVVCGKATVKSTNISTMFIRCPVTLEGRYVGVRVTEAVRSLYLCEVQVFKTADGDLNIALGMRSGPSDSTSGNSADRAVDGNRNTRLLDGSCFQSRRKGNPFWFVDLGSLYRIREVRITTSTEDTDYGIDHNSIIYVTNAKKDHPPIYNNTEQCNKTGIIAYGGSKDLLCAKPVVGRFVYIQAYGHQQNSLSLCEVEVYGDKVYNMPVVENDKKTTVKVVTSKTTVSPNTKDNNITGTSSADELDTVRCVIKESTMEPMNAMKTVVPVLAAVIVVLVVIVAISSCFHIHQWRISRAKQRTSDSVTAVKNESEYGKKGFPDDYENPTKGEPVSSHTYANFEESASDSMENTGHTYQQLELSHDNTERPTLASGRPYENENKYDELQFSSLT